MFTVVKRMRHKRTVVINEFVMNTKLDHPWAHDPKVTVLFSSSLVVAEHCCVSTPSLSEGVACNR